MKFFLRGTANEKLLLSIHGATVSLEIFFVDQLWMNSSGHKANLLNKNAKKINIRADDSECISIQFFHP